MPSPLFRDPVRLAPARPRERARHAPETHVRLFRARGESRERSRSRQHAIRLPLFDRGGGTRARVLPGCRRAGILDAGRGRRTRAHDSSLLRREPAAAGARRDRLSRLLLPFPRSADGQARARLRALDDGHGDPARRGTDGGAVFRPGRSTRGGNPSLRGFALPRRGLALGARRRPRRQPRLDAGRRISPVPMGGLQRSAPPLRARPRGSDPSSFQAELRRVDGHLRMEEALRY